MTPPIQIRDGRPSPPKPARGIPPKQARGIPPKPARGIQLSLAARPTSDAATDAPSRVPSLPHPPCPICAGPTARHAGRAVCVVCGHGAQERGLPYHPRRHPN